MSSSLVPVYLSIPGGGNGFSVWELERTGATTATYPSNVTVGDHMRIRRAYLDVDKLFEEGQIWVANKTAGTTGKDDWDLLFDNDYETCEGLPIGANPLRDVDSGRVAEVPAAGDIALCRRLSSDTWDYARTDSNPANEAYSWGIPVRYVTATTGKIIPFGKPIHPTGRKLGGDAGTYSGLGTGPDQNYWHLLDTGEIWDGVTSVQTPAQDRRPIGVMDSEAITFYWD